MENYQKQLDKILKQIQKQTLETGKVPKLLLHSCCAPCSSYVLEYLSSFLDITVFYFNPNISPEMEYQARIIEQKRLIEQMPFSHSVDFMEGAYCKEQFYQAVKGYETLLEGGERCFRCYALRLRETARIAREKNYDFFTTTLTISPFKNAEKLNEIGKAAGEEYKVNYLYSDFKKKNGYQRSIELSKLYKLYRQNYCGCIFSKQEAKIHREMKEKESDRNKFVETNGIL